MTKEKQKEIKQWSKNIANNIKNGYDAVSEIYEAVKELNLNFKEVDHRWQFTNADELEDWRWVYFVLTGKNIGRGF